VNEKKTSVKSVRIDPSQMLEEDNEQIWNVPFVAKDKKEYFFVLKASSTPGWYVAKVQQSGDKLWQDGADGTRHIYFHFDGKAVTKLSIILPGHLIGKGIGSEFYRRLAKVLPQDAQLEQLIKNDATRKYLVDHFGTFKTDLKAGRLSLNDFLAKTPMGLVCGTGFGEHAISLDDINGGKELTGFDALERAVLRASGGLSAPFKLISKKSVQKDIFVSGSLEAGENAPKRVAEKGGIDLNIDRLDLQITAQTSAGIKFNIDPAMFAAFEAAPGFVPVITGILPLKDLQQFLETPLH